MANTKGKWIEALGVNYTLDLLPISAASTHKNIHRKGVAPVWNLTMFEF